MNEIINMNNIKSICYWTDGNGDIKLPGDSALAHRSEKDLPPAVAAVYKVLNTDSGFCERVVTLNGRCGLLLDILYDKDWVMETVSAFHTEISDETVMNALGAALPCLAQAMANDIHKLYEKAGDDVLCNGLKVLVGINTDVDGHELAVFVPIEDDAATNSTVLIQCARAVRIAECYLNHAAYNTHVEKWIRDLVAAVSIDTVDNYSFVGV